MYSFVTIITIECRHICPTIWDGDKPRVRHRYRTTGDDTGCLCTELKSSLLPAPMAWRGWSRLLGLGWVMRRNITLCHLEAITYKAVTLVNY